MFRLVLILALAAFSYYEHLQAKAWEVAAIQAQEKLTATAKLGCKAALEATWEKAVANPMSLFTEDGSSPSDTNQ